LQTIQVNTSLDMRDILINPVYELMVPPHSKEKYEELKQSINENGLYEPIIINTENEILDGHHRFKACKEVNVIPRYQIKQFDTDEDERLYVIETNLYRRQLTVFQEVELRAEVERIKAQQRQLSNLNNVGEKGSLSSIDDNGRVNEVISSKINGQASPKNDGKSRSDTDVIPTLKELAAIYKHYEPQVRIGQGKRTDLTSGKFPEVHRTRDVIGNIAGVSGRTLEKAVKIVDAAQENPDVLYHCPTCGKVIPRHLVLCWCCGAYFKEAQQ